MHEHILLFDDSYAYYVVARHLFSYVESIIKNHYLA